MTGGKAIQTAIALGAILGLNSVSATSGTFWRGLIVYTNNWDNMWQGHNFYEDHFSTVFSEINDIYAASYHDSNTFTAAAQIAGVIWDKNYLAPSPHQGLSDIRNGTNGMGQYVDLLDEYAADFIILVDTVSDQNDPSLGGLAFILDTNNLPSHGAFWVRFAHDGRTWAHEAGHVHGLSHCHGYRQTFDANGDFASTNADTGFYTVMAYQTGNANECSGTYNDGQQGLTAMFSTETFSNPFLTWTNDVTQRTYATGTSINNATAIHETNSPIIRNFHNTPTNLTITDDMAIGENGYADFLATGSALIEEGFSVQASGRMRISVGELVLTKRGISKNDIFLPEKKAQKRIGPISNYISKYDASSKSLRISFNADRGTTVSIDVYNAKGILKQKLQGSSPLGEKYARSFPVGDLPQGTYYLRVQANQQRIYSKFVK